jgi:CHASE2 domain-containing sensor protein
MNGMGAAAMLDGFWRMGLASLVMALLTWLVQQPLQTGPLLWQLLLSGSIGGITYLLLCLALRVHEVQQFWHYARRRLTR